MKAEGRGGGGGYGNLLQPTAWSVNKEIIQLLKF
jgi:hypothetical protein